MTVLIVDDDRFHFKLACDRAAHSVKGCLSNFSALGAIQAAQKLEGIGIEEDLCEAGEAFRLLEWRIPLLQSAMDDFEKVRVS
jgi:hypothetical protein